MSKELGVDSVLWAGVSSRAGPLLLGALCSAGWDAQSQCPLSDARDELDLG